MDSRPDRFSDQKPVPARRIAALIFPEFQSLDAIGPLEVFSTTCRILRRDRRAAAPVYRVGTIAATEDPVPASSGLRLMPDATIDQPAGDIDTLIVAGGEGVRQAVRDRQLLDWLAATAPRVRRLASVCSGAFLLAEAGLLDGRRATTHWEACDVLARHYPNIAVEPDAIFVRDGNVYSSAGVTAGMDLALALVEEDFGRRAAMDAARQLVMFVKRPGGQSQFSAQLAAQRAGDGPVGRVQSWIVANLRQDLSVTALAAHAAMSPRHFARVFARQAGVTPAAFVERARVDAARRYLADGAASIDRVARDCGFADAEQLRRAFQRLLGVAPRDYRTRFNSTSQASPEGRAAP